MKNLLKPLKSKKRSLRNDLKLLTESGLFHRDWYVAEYGAEIPANKSAEEHYIRKGEKAGNRPNRYFDPAWYMERSGAARRFNGPALAHYALTGWRNGHSPSLEFSSKLYLEHNPDVRETGLEPLLHYFTKGQQAGAVVLEHALSYPDNVHMIDDVIAIHKSGVFIEDWYRQYYTDLWDSTESMITHFVRQGVRERRQPNPFFNTGWYVDHYGQDVGSENPLLYYLQEGYKKGHKPASGFDAALYFKRNHDLDADAIEPMTYHVTRGMREGRSSPFDAPDAKTKAGTRIEAEAELPVPDTLRALVKHEQQPLAPTNKSFNPACMNIHWVIPDFAAGGGGHMTIFRMVRHLEQQGHQQTIWVHNPTQHETPLDAHETILKHFQHFTGAVKFVDDSFKEASGDAIIATDCWTVWPVLSVSDFKRRFYFVQDFEPSFHAMGSNYLAAEATYREDLDCICASPWLKEKMEQDYGRWASAFWLAADTNLYHPLEEKPENSIPRIAVYARHFTERRAVEFAMLALEELAKRGVDFEVDFFGAPLDLEAAPFGFVDHDVASPEALANIFQNADIGLVFSATNYSLVPQEMMACGLPLIELAGDNTRAIFPESVATLADPHPRAIANALERLITSPEERSKQADTALKWVQSFSWGKSAQMVEDAISTRLLEYAEPQKEDQTASKNIKASVVIPTWNAGPVLKKVLDSVTAQVAPWPFEILVIDSGSTDGTLDLVQSYPTVKLHEIDQSTFNHGATRNLGVELTTGEFIAFLTHDAQPANENWLYNLVTSIEMYDGAAGAFGKHLAWPEASDFTKRDLNAHFDMLNNHPLCLNRDTNKRRYEENDAGWRQLLHFYSDNNSCMRRSIWENIPYRTVKFGEDQLWADDIIAAGMSKVYAPRAVVYHSHDYDADETFERNMTESAFFKHFFGYELVKDEEELERTLNGLNRHDSEWAERNNVDEDEVELRKELNKARLEGYLAGVRADTSDMF